MRLLDPFTVPPGGFRYVCPETAARITAASLGELVANSTNHRKANNLPVTQDFAREIEEQLCGTMPPGTCKHEAGVVMTGPRRLTFADVVSATKTLGAWFLKGTPKVNQAEAERRARICLSCPMNQNFDGCTTCAERDLREAMVSFMGDSKTEYDANLHTCFTCGCTLKAAIWFPLSLLQNNMTDETKALLPKHCWKA